MEENRFYILGAKLLTGNISAEEVIEFDDIMYRNPGYKELYEDLENNLSIRRSYELAPESTLELLREKITELDMEETPQYLLDSGEENITYVRRNKIFSVVTLTIILGAIGFFYFLNKKPVTENSIVSIGNDIVTKPGSKSHVKLPDGTRVILNADSKISYPDNFVGNTREVTLEGEAFFEVHEDPSKPFIIHARSMDIKVLGTVFNVKAYPEESRSEASLISGSIEILVKNRTNGKVYLKPNEKIVISEPLISQEKIDEVKDNTASSMISIEKIIPDNSDDAIDEIAWKDNKLVFYDEPFSSLAVKLERWYGKTIEIRSERLRNTKFTGKFYNENIVQVLNALQKMGNFKYTHDKNAIIIW